MDHQELMAALESESAAFADAAAGHLDAPVPSCDGWSVSDLVAHLGRLYGWVASILEAAGDPPGHRGPEAEGDLMDWFARQRAKVIEELSNRDPAAPAWVFIPSVPHNAGWWTRRQALESAVHRVDAELASGTPRPVDADLAIEGLDEMLLEIVPAVFKAGRIGRVQGTFHLHATDAEGEWLVDLSGDEPVTSREHAKADVALRGPASGLYLWSWNRLDVAAAGLEVFGDDKLVSAWQSISA